MSISAGMVAELKIADVLTFLTVQRCGSISSAARELMVTPSQVSKTVSRLEDLLGAPLLSRSANGITLLDEGRRLVPQFEQLLELANGLRGQPVAAPRVIGIAAPSYLAHYFIPLIAAADPTLRLRALELPPAQVRSLMASAQFQVAIGLGDLHETTAWESHVAGEIEKALFASPTTAARLGGSPIARALLAEQPIISPIYMTDGGILPVDDDCPITRRERTVGHEAMTLGIGLALAARTEQLVFGPVIGALPYLEAGTLVKVAVEGFALRDSVRIVCNTDRITRTQQRMMIGAIERGIAAIRF